MIRFLFVGISGWVALILFATEVLLAYLLRRSRLSLRLGLAAAFSAGGLRHMRPHYLLGAALPALAFAHAWVPMSAGTLRGINLTGLWLATVALLLLVVQLALGVALANSHAPVRRNLKRAHLAGMLLLSALIVAHIALNG